ncbi:MAG: acyltransferase [Myxococcota bacterium]
MSASPLKSRFEPLLAKLPISALRDVVVKRPSIGPNLDALDGIRGLAVTLVIASHCDAFHLKGQGAVGVFLFFSLSAFLLTLPFQETPTSAAHLRHYASRRIRRILPIYYCVILFSFFWRDGAGLTYLWKHLLFIRADGIFWTIPQEMLFYLLLPLLAQAHFVLFRRNFALTAAAFLLFAGSCQAFLDESVFTLNGNGKQLRFQLGIFATGIAFAYAYRCAPLTRIAMQPAVNRALGWLGMAILVFLVLSANYYHKSVLNFLPLVGPWFAGLHVKLGLYYKGTFGFLCSLLIYITLVCRTRLIHRIMSSLTLRALGITSYSLYLVHIIVRDAVATSLGVGMGNELFWLTLAAAYGLACILYAVIERPFMQMKTR